jgi:hypothetical protein
MRKGNLVHVDMSDDLDGSDVRIGTVIRQTTDDDDGFLAEVTNWWVMIEGREELVTEDQVIKVIG